MKALVVFGARPEAIKLAAGHPALRQEPQAEVVAVSTGQHQQMLDQTLENLWLRRDEDGPSCRSTGTRFTALLSA